MDEKINADQFDDSAESLSELTEETFESGEKLDRAILYGLEKTPPLLYGLFGRIFELPSAKYFVPILQGCVGLSIFLLIAIGLFFWIRSPSFETFIDWVRNSLGIWGYLLMAFINFLWCFPWMVGYVIIAMTTGYIFGWVGLAVMMVGNSMGFIGCFYMVKYLGANWFHRYFGTIKYFKAAIFAIKEHPIKITALLRAGPVTVGFSTSILALSSIDFTTYFITSIIAHLPKDLMFIGFGHHTMNSISDIIQGNLTGDAATVNIAFVSVQVVCFVLLSLVMMYYGQQALKNIEKEARESGEELDDIENENNENSLNVNLDRNDFHSQDSNED